MDTATEWRACDEWPDYETTADGQVRNRNTGRILKQHSHVAGYRMCAILYPVRRQIGVHRLVADAWMGRCPSDRECHHKDHDKTNNHRSNLAYVTHQENIRAARDAGMFPDMRGRNSPRKGICVPEAVRLKLSIAKRGALHVRAVTVDPLEVLRLYTDGMTMQAIAGRFGISRTTAGDIIRGTHWSVRPEYKRRSTYKPVSPLFPDSVEK